MHYHHTNRAPIDYNWKSWKAQIFSEEVFREGQSQEGSQNKTLEEIEVPGTYSFRKH